MDSKNNSGETVSSLMIVKVVIGIVFIILGGYLMLNKSILKTTPNLSYKYDETTAKLVKTSKNGDSYDGHYEYTFNERIYKAISNKSYSSEGDVPKEQTIQVNRENPEDYVFGIKEEPKVDKTVYIIPGILIVFGLASIVLSLKRII
jgi:hypothetical protein